MFSDASIEILIIIRVNLSIAKEFLWGEKQTNNQPTKNKQK